MQDVITGYLIIAFLACGGFFAIRERTRDWSDQSLNRLGLGIIAITTLYSIFVWESLWLTKVVPFSNLIIVSNIYPIAALMLAAISLNRLRDETLRGAIPALSLFLSAGWSMLYPLLGSAPQCQENWDDYGICYQTTDETCTAAAGATLLNYYKISTSEEEMAALCLTRNGTSWKGLYRGLKLKTAGTDYQVKVETLTPQQLGLAQQPVVIRVGRRNLLNWGKSSGLPEGWNEGEIHSVVCLGRMYGYFVIADPNPEIGIEYWTLGELESVWDGHSATIERHRSPNQPQFYAMTTWDRMRQVSQR